jgi:hypothetical protein
MDIFGNPEKRSDGSYKIPFLHPVTLGDDIRWDKTSRFPTPELGIQSMIQSFREKTLASLTRTVGLFRTPPSLSYLKGIAPTWGILIRGGSLLEWSQQDVWCPRPPEIAGKNATVTLVAEAVLLSRQCIVPVWGVKVKQILPETSPMIDFDFGEEGVEDEENEAKSVYSDELVSEEGEVVRLVNPQERKRQSKAIVRELLEKASLAKIAAEEAMERFFSEFDLSEGESDFSEDDEDSSSESDEE